MNYAIITRIYNIAHVKMIIPEETD
jgi:hypothetical protein